MAALMTMNDVFELRTDDLKAYYDSSISTLENLTDYKNKIARNKRKIRDNKERLLLVNRTVMLSLFSFIIISFDFAFAYVLASETFDYATNGIILAVAISLVGVLIVVFLFRSKWVKNCFANGNKKINNDIVALDREISEYQDSIEQIKGNAPYKNMMLVFDDVLDLEYMKALRKIISTGRARRHEEAVKIHAADVRFEKDRHIKEQLVTAEQEKARGLDRISESQSELASSINSLSSKVSELNIKCQYGSATKEDGNSVLEAASNCSSLVLNLAELMKLFI